MARIAAGEGGAALALRADSLAALAGRLEAAGVPAVLERYGSAFATLAFTDAESSWLFLIEYLRPVVDPPDLLSHPNTAVGIETVWLTERAFATLPAIADHLCIPAVRQAPDAAGEAPVAGVTLRVRSIDAAQQRLRAAGVEVPIRTDERGRSVVVPATRAHGMFIEFMEPDSSPTPQPGAGSLRSAHPCPWSRTWRPSTITDSREEVRWHRHIGSRAGFRPTAR